VHITAGELTFYADAIFVMIFYTVCVFSFTYTVVAFRVTNTGIAKGLVDC